MILSGFEKSVFEMLHSCIDAYYAQSGVEHHRKSDSREEIEDFFSWLYRGIPRINRTVCYSNELQKRIDTGDVAEEHFRTLEMFRQRFETAQDMNGFLSRGAWEIDRGDYLRYTWHLFHLHLSNRVASNREEMRHNRSGFLLLAAITSKEVLFVDVIQHPATGKSCEFFNLDHLRMIRDNGWLEKIGFMKIDAMTVEPVSDIVNSNEAFYSLYKSNINVPFVFDDSGYIANGGVVANGQLMESVCAYNQLYNNLRILNLFDNGMENKKKSFSVELTSSANNRLAIVVRIEYDNGAKKCIDLLTGKEYGT